MTRRAPPDHSSNEGQRCGTMVRHGGGVLTSPLLSRQRVLKDWVALRGGAGAGQPAAVTPARLVSRLSQPCMEVRRPPCRTMLRHATPRGG